MYRGKTQVVDRLNSLTRIPIYVFHDERRCHNSSERTSILFSSVLDSKLKGYTRTVTWHDIKTTKNNQVSRDAYF